VLYVDLEMTKRQIEARYTSDRVRPGDRGYRYQFSDNLRYIGFNAYDAMSECDAEKTAEILARRIDREVREHDIDVVILDSLTALKRSYYGSTELLPVMRRLRRLMLERELSVLVLADVPRGDKARPMTLRSLGGLRLAANVADSIVGLAQGGAATDERYIKHLRSRSSEIVFDDTHLPLFLLCKNESAFLGFEFIEYTNEPEQMIDDRHAAEANLTSWVYREVKDKGRSIRAVAAQIGRAKSTVHRMVKLHEPLPGDEDYREGYGRDDAEPAELTSADENGAQGGDNGVGVHERAGHVGVADGGVRAPPG
jgi:hypothetical protein